MRFIVDAQLPPALARHLVSLGYQAEHVIDCDLAGASDRAIWDFAVANAAIIVTKDEDFAAKRAVSESGPIVIWIRIGNATNPKLLKALASGWSSILAVLNSGETVIEVT